jgi:hypothetical protein
MPFVSGQGCQSPSGTLVRIPPLHWKKRNGRLSANNHSPPPSRNLGKAEMSNKSSYQKGMEEQRSHDEEGGHQQESSSSSLNMMTSIRNQLVSDLALDLSSIHRRIVEFRVSWGLLDFIDKELQEGQSLASVLTISGSPQNAYATSCENYLKTFWPGVGQNILVVIDDAWSTKGRLCDVFSSYSIWVNLWHQAAIRAYDKPSSHSIPTCQTSKMARF